jgi:hypothetical protein
VSAGGKPQGVSGAFAIGPEGASFAAIKFPTLKAEREALIASLFVNAFEGWVANESAPSLKPFNALQQNPENDLDFTVETSLGSKSMELVEFAPLAIHGPRFVDAPRSVHPKDKAALAFDAICRKSEHQGGDNRFLVTYATEHAFWLDAITIERLRRLLNRKAPKFDRVYYISVHDLGSASVSEIFPGQAHHTFGDFSDEQMDRIGVYLPHPAEMVKEARFLIPDAGQAKAGGSRRSLSMPRSFYAAPFRLRVFFQNEGLPPWRRDARWKGVPRNFR